MQILFDRPPSSELERDAAEVAATRATIGAISSGPSHGTPDVPRGGEPFAIVAKIIEPQTVAPTTRDYLRQLARCANAAAASLACGSLLAGHTSETDEYGDISVWLGSGDYSPGHELDVLAALGLEHLVGQGGRIKEVKLSPDTGLPTTVHIPADTNHAFSRLQELLCRLQDIHMFSLHSDPYVYLLLGRYDAEDQSGFAGLLGLGVQS